MMPSFSSHSQSDDSEREDHAMAAQISALSEQVTGRVPNLRMYGCLCGSLPLALAVLQNQQLETQLREMEQERERLREMLSGEKKAAAVAGDTAYTPPGLPSKVRMWHFSLNLV